MKTTTSLLLLLLLSLLGCKQKEDSQPQTLLPENTEKLTEEEINTIHTDTAYKYEYRTGTSGDYGYNYDVSGYDDSGNEITGNVSMEDKYGTGYITNSDGDEIDVEVEWTGYGELKATDSDGNEYELTVD
jgi:hypothetical protein